MRSDIVLLEFLEERKYLTAFGGGKDISHGAWTGLNGISYGFWSGWRKSPMALASQIEDQSPYV
jgi:hypothetical protein